MKKLLSLIMTPPVPVILGTILLVLLIQIGWEFLSEAWPDVFSWLSQEWANGLCIAVVVLVVGSIVFRRLQARSKARSIEAEIRAQGQVHLDALPPTSRSDMEELQERFDEALESLRASKLGRGALYALPWYVIIGPPGSGKTTAITESGLNFPFLKGKSQGRGIRGLGGTRNCDWWFTDQSILLDTAGRYTTQSEDRDEWLSFLGMIKRSRQQKPINGVMVAIAITDLLGATQEAIEQHAVTIRERIDELVKELEVVFPVYLVFTKCDLLDGFVESFNTLSKEERAQVWGATFSEEAGESRDTAKRFREEFGALCGRVDEERLRLLIPDQPAEKQRKILSLGMQMRSAAQPLGDFVAKLTEPNPYSEGSELRGFYFTSGTQEGAPIDFVMDKMSSALGLAPGATSSPMLDAEAKSYFLRDLFADVMYGDRDLAHSSSAALKRQSLVRSVVTYGSAAVAIAGCVLCFLGWASTKDLYAEYGRLSAASANRQISAARQSDLGDDDKTPLNEQRKALEKMREDLGRVSLFKASNDAVAEAASDYTWAIRDVFLSPIHAYVQEKLEGVRRDDPASITPKDVARLQHWLTVYQALSDNPVPILNGVLDDAFRKALLWRWNPREIGEPLRAQHSDPLWSHLGTFIKVRNTMNKGGIFSYDASLIRYIQDCIDSNDEVGGRAGEALADDPNMSLAEVKQQVAIDLSTPDQALDAAADKAVEREYKQNIYKRLIGYDFGDLSTISGLATALIKLTRGNPEINDMMRQLRADKLVSDGDAIAEKYQGALAKISAYFKVPIDELNSRGLTFLNEDIRDLKSADDKSSWWETLKTANDNSVEHITQQVKELEQALASSTDGDSNANVSEVSGWIEDALKDVVHRILDSVARQLREPLQDRWDGEISDLVTAGLKKFPFEADEQGGISKDDFKRLFGPESALFELEKQIEWLDAHWPKTESVIGSVVLKPACEAFYEDAHRIRDAFFASPEVAAVNFRIWGFPQMDDDGDITVTETAFSLKGSADAKTVKISTKNQLNSDIQDMSFKWAVGDFSQLAVQAAYNPRPIMRPKITSDAWSLFRLLAEGKVTTESDLTKVVWTLPYATDSSEEQVKVAINFYSAGGGQVFGERFFAVRTFEDLFAADEYRPESGK